MSRMKATPWGEDEQPDAAFAELGRVARPVPIERPRRDADTPAATPAPAPAPAGDADDLADLADVFDDLDPTPVPAAVTPPPSPAADDFDALADVFGGDPATPAAPVAAPAAPAPMPTPAVRVRAEVTDVAPPEWLAARRWERIDRLWAPIEAVLTIAASDDFAAQQLRELKITRDRDLDETQRRKFIDVLRPKLLGSGALPTGRYETADVLDMAYDEYIGLGPLSGPWWDDDVTEILVDGPDKVYVERNGHLQPTPVRFRNLDHLQAVARNLSEKISDRQVSPSNPLVTAELPGARVQFAYGDVVKTGVSITLRKFRPLMGMAELLRRGSLSLEMAEFLADAVAARATTLVSGGTGTGKTTFINALSEAIPAGERVVTIEDAFELQLSTNYVVNMQTKEKATQDSNVKIEQADLMVAALRMRPDRIIVGEVREANAAKVVMQAANTGHDGTMTTIHANTPHAALNFRLTALLQTATGMSSDVALREVATALDLVVQVTRRAGVRYVSEIAVVDPSCVVGNELKPRTVFTGTLGPDGSPVFSRVAGLPGDSTLAVKLAEAGIDPARWA